MKNFKKLLILTLVFSTAVTTSYEIDPLEHQDRVQGKK